MPAIAVAAAAWIGEAVTAITTSAAIGAAVANTVAALGFAQGIGAALTAWGTVASLSSLAMGPPKVGQSAGTQIQFKADPNAGIPIAFGSTGTAGNIVFVDTAGPKNAHLLYLTVLSLGPIQAITGFTANSVPLTFNTGSDFSVVGSSYSGKMWQKTEAGSITPATFDPPAPNPPSEWTASCKLTGLAKSWWVLAYDQGKYPAGTPQPLWAVQGVLCYDPRHDGTYPGGSGTQRLNDQTTWAYSENPAICALTWCIGFKQNGKRVAGIGAPAAMIDIPAFVEAANVADANGWKVGGVVTTQDGKSDVLTALLACGAAWPVSLGSMLSCGVDTPRVSLATMTKDDAAGAVSISGVQPTRDRINGVIPSYRSADNGYAVVAAARVGVSAYETADGEQRTRQIEWSLCPFVNQATQLAGYVVQDARELGPIVIPAKPRWMGYRPNDCVTITEPEWNLNGQKCLILKRDRDPATGVTTFTLRTETDAKHAFALGLTGTAPPAPAMTGFDPTAIGAPGAGAFTATGTTLTSAAGAIPAIVVTGSTDDAHADRVVVQYRLSGAGSWTSASPVLSPGLGVALRIELAGVTSGAAYDVQVGYISPRGVPSAFTSLGTVAAGSFSLAIYDAAISDGVLTPAEKLTVIPRINGLINARSSLRAQADALGLTVASSNADRVNYENAATNLDSYLASLTSPVAWNVTSGNTTIAVPATFRTRLQDATTYETNLQTAIDTAAQSLINTAIADGVLTPAEKLSLIPIINGLINARSSLRTQADAVGLTVASSNADRVNYENAATNLDSYLASLTSPVAWNVTTGNTTIASPSTFRTRLQDAATYETNLQSAIDKAAQGLANMPGANLVFDGGFKLHAQRWTLGTGWIWAQDVAFGPVLFTSTGGSNIAASPEFSVAANDPYVLSAKMIGVGIAAGAVQVDVQWLNSSHSQISISTAVVSLSDGNPHYLSQPLTSPAGAAFAVARLRTNGVTFSSGAFWCQGIKLALGTTATGWSDETTSQYLQNQYTDPVTGNIGDWHAFPVNLSGLAAYRTSVTLSATDTTITVGGYTETRVGSNITVPSGTITGVSAATAYSVYYDMVGNVCVAVDVASAGANQVSTTRYLQLGFVTTANSGGGTYPSPPLAPPGYTGGGSLHKVYD